MRNATLIFSLSLLGCPALTAQARQSGIGVCDQKPEIQQIVEVGDRALHVVGIVKQNCHWTMPLEMAGLKAKDYTIIVMTDATGNGPLNSQDRGYVVINMDNGDQAFARFEGKGTVSRQAGEPASGAGTWSYTDGTGKLKGLTGKGTYNGGINQDQVEEEHIQGEWSISEPKKK